MIVNSKPRMGGKSMDTAKYMTAPGNGDVICVAPTKAQAEIVYRYAQDYEPGISRSRFLTSREIDRLGQKRYVFDEADAVIEQLVHGSVEMVSLTESKPVLRGHEAEPEEEYVGFVAGVLRHQIYRLEIFGGNSDRLPAMKRALKELES